MNYAIVVRGNLNHNKDELKVYGPYSKEDAAELKNSWEKLPQYLPEYDDYHYQNVYPYTLTVTALIP